jgi:hypothetical protein
MSAASGIMERPAIWPVLSSLAIPTGASPFHNPSFCETADWAGTTAFQNLIYFRTFSISCRSNHLGSAARPTGGMTIDTRASEMLTQFIVERANARCSCP